MKNKTLFEAWANPGKFYQLVDTEWASGKHANYVAAWQYVETTMAALFGRPKYTSYMSYRNARARYSKTHGLTWPRMY
jgi:hypothetical protein